MKVGPVGIVYRKELLDIVRDRRTLFSAILLPLLLFPVMTLGFGTLAYVFARKAAQEAAPVMVIGSQHAPELVKKFRREDTFELEPAAKDYVQRINDKKLRAAVEFPEGFEERLRKNPNESLTVKIYWYEGELRSRTTVRRIEKILEEFREKLVEARLGQRGLEKALLTPFKFERKNVAPPEKVSGNILGFILPYFVIVLCLTGAMYPAIDLTAGEKERGTIETILASPLKRGEIVAGKFLVVLTASLVTTAFSILSFTVTAIGGAELLSRVDKDFVLAVSAKATAAVFFIVLPLAVFFSAALLAICMIARSYREAQGYVGPLLILVILPAMASFIPGTELNTRLALIPVLNVSLVAKEIFAGTFHWPIIGLIFASTTVYAGAALVLATWLFKRESVLFRT